MNTLLKNETIITQSNLGAVTLTNVRIQYATKEWGKEHMVSILLKNISSIEASYKSNIILVFLAVASIVGAFIMGAEYLIGIIIISTILLIVFFLTRQHYLIISSNGGAKINFLVKGMKTKEILAFLNKVEQAIIDNSIDR